MYRNITGCLIVSRPPELHVEILLGFLISAIVSGPPICIIRKEIVLLLSLSSTVSGPLALRMEILHSASLGRSVPLDVVYGICRWLPSGDIDGIKFYSYASSCNLLCRNVNTEFSFLTDVASYRNINDSDSLCSCWWCPW